MKMGTIVSPWRYDAGACHAPQSAHPQWILDERRLNVLKKSLLERSGYGGVMM
jgi:hypothetical protein